MFLTKKHLSRRSVLRGMGVTMALPLLDSMVPAQTPLQRRRRLRRRAWLASKWCTARREARARARTSITGRLRKIGRDFEMSQTLEPLEPYRDYLTIVSDTDLHPATAWAAAEEGADHFRSSAVYLTAAHPKMTEGSDYFVGTSIDQLYAQKFGQDTPLPSIQLCIEMVDASGACDYGYACVYADTISWASPTEPLPMTLDPRMAFENLFGEGGTPEDRLARGKVNTQHSRLDRAGRKALTEGLGTGRSPPAERLSRRCPRDRTADSEDREIQCQRRSARAAGGSARGSGFVRRACPADVRPAGAGIHDRRHARFGVQTEPRRQRTRVAGERREDALPSVLASRRESCEDRGIRKAESLPRQPASVLPGQAEEHSGWRRESAGSFDGDVRQSDGRFECSQSQAGAAGAGWVTRTGS